MPENVYERIAERIRAIRKAQGLSMETLAERAGMTASYLGQIERGERKFSLQMLVNIRTALGVPPSYFFPRSKQGNAKIPKLPLTRRIMGVLEGLPPKQREVVWDTLMFVIRQRRRRNSRRG